MTSIKLKHFVSFEFREDQGERLCLSEMNSTLLSMLDSAREAADCPFIITSSLRSVEHNASVGGASLSSHLFGDAVDIYVDEPRRARIIAALFGAGFRRIGIYSHHVHVDVSDRADSNFAARVHYVKSPAVWHD